MTTTTISNYVNNFSFTSSNETLVVTSTGTVGKGVVAAASIADAQIDNYGIISGGISLGNGGRIVNGSNADQTAAINGKNAIIISNLSGTVVNYGTITGTSRGIWLNDGGRIVNGSNTDRTAEINDKTIIIANASGTILNYGTIISHLGVGLSDGGLITNGSASDTTATIIGRPGVTSGTVINFGKIQGLVSGTPTIVNGSAIDRKAQMGGVSFETEGIMETVSNFATITGTVQLMPGGILTNGAAGDTTALIHDVYGYGDRGGPTTIAETVVNFGRIERGFDVGVGVLRNGTASDRTAYVGVFTGAGSIASTVINFGTIGYVDLHDGTVTNGSASDTSAQLVSGIGFHGGTGILTNFGTIGDGARGFGTDAKFVNGSATDRLALISEVTLVSYGTASGTVSNFGTIENTTSAFNGVAIEIGKVVNGSASDTVALIAGEAAGIRAGNATITAAGGVTIANYGTIKALSTSGTYSGVVVANGGLVVNGPDGDRKALISGAYGVFDQNGRTTVTNFGTIKGFIGVDVAPTAAATEAVTVTNTGTIIGTGGTAVLLGRANDLMILGTGASFVGVVDGGTGSNTLRVGVNSTGTLSGIGTEFVDFQTIQVEAGADWTLAGSIVASDRVAFAGKDATFRLTDTTGFKAAIRGFAATDTLDLATIDFGGGTSLSYAGGTLTVADGTHTAKIKLIGQYMAAGFHDAGDGSGGTAITYTPPPAQKPQLASTS